MDPGVPSFNQNRLPILKFKFIVHDHGLWETVMMRAVLAMGFVVAAHSLIFPLPAIRPSQRMENIKPNGFHQRVVFGSIAERPFSRTAKSKSTNEGNAPADGISGTLRKIPCFYSFIACVFDVSCILNTLFDL